MWTNQEEFNHRIREILVSFLASIAGGETVEYFLTNNPDVQILYTDIDSINLEKNRIRTELDELREIVENIGISQNNSELETILVHALELVRGNQGDQSTPETVDAASIQRDPSSIQGTTSIWTAAANPTAAPNPTDDITDTEPEHGPEDPLHPAELSIGVDLAIPEPPVQEEEEGGTVRIINTDPDSARPESTVQEEEVREDDDFDDEDEFNLDDEDLEELETSSEQQVGSTEHIVKHSEIVEDFNNIEDTNMLMFIFVRYSHLPYHYTLNDIHYKLVLNGSQIISTAV